MQKYDRTWTLGRKLDYANAVAPLLYPSQTTHVRIMAAGRGDYRAFVDIDLPVAPGAVPYVRRERLVHRCRGCHPALDDLVEQMFYDYHKQTGRWPDDVS